MMMKALTSNQTREHFWWQTDRGTQPWSFKSFQIQFQNWQKHSHWSSNQLWAELKLTPSSILPLLKSCKLLILFYNFAIQYGPRVFSSHERKAQVSFSDHNSSVVFVVVVNFSHFHLLLQNNWANFQPNLAQTSLKWRGFKFIQMKSPAFFHGETITK